MEPFLHTGFFCILWPGSFECGKVEEGKVLVDLLKYLCHYFEVIALKMKVFRLYLVKVCNFSFNEANWLYLWKGNYVSDSKYIPIRQDYFFISKLLKGFMGGYKLKGHLMHCLHSSEITTLEFSAKSLRLSKWEVFLENWPNWCLEKCFPFCTLSKQEPQKIFLIRTLICVAEAF